MKRAISVLTIALLLLAGVVLAADGYDLSWHAISGGGGRTTAGAWAVDGAVLQPAGVMQGGDYQLASGFWSFTAAAAVKAPRVWLPVLLRGTMLP
jgi:hypothetical protein